MSNVIKASALYSGTEQPAVIGKIYEQLFTDSSGNDMVRYLRCFKAGSAVTAGQVLGAAVGATFEMHTTGACVPAADAGALRNNVYGVALADVASGSYGFACCRGVVEKVASEAGTAEGDPIMVGATDGRVDDTAVSSAGDSLKIIGTALSTVSSNTVTAYINVL
jgi:hypothetical protein